MRVDVDRSFIHFVYPFLFEAEDFPTRAETVEHAQWPGRDGKTLGVWEKDKFPQDDLLPHVSLYLNKTASPTAVLWQLSGDALQSPRGLGAGAHSPQAQWSLVTGKRTIPFRIEAVRLALFRLGVGFLTICAEPTETAVSDWLDFVHHFRFLAGSRACTVRAERRADARVPTPFFPPCAPSLPEESDNRQRFGLVVAGLLCTANQRANSGRWWQDVFVPDQMIPFATLFADQLPEETDPVLLYRLRNFFTADCEIAPGPADLATDHPSLLPYTDRGWLAVSLNGAVFFAANAKRTEFFTVTLPGHLREQYFLVFLLSLQQRFTLSKLSQLVAERWLYRVSNEPTRVREFTRIRDDLLEFTARGYFAQVMQQEHHHRWYLKCQETFQVARLYSEVKEEVGDMYGCLLLAQNERLERRISRLWILIGIPALIVGFLGINIIGYTSTGEGLQLWQALTICLAGGVFLASLAQWLLGR